MTTAAILLSVVAWVVGLFADANMMSSSYYVGFLELRILLPMLTMGGFLLHQLQKK